MSIDIEKLAREAGVCKSLNGCFYQWELSDLERFAALVLEQAAQECIAVCTDDRSTFGYGYNLASIDCESAILAMKPKDAE